MSKKTGTGLKWGEGSYYQLDSGRWHGRWYIEGQRHSETFDSEEEVRKHLIDVGKDRRRGVYVTPSDMTVEEVVRDYLERGKESWSANTYATYGQRAMAHILPYLGKDRARDLTTARVQWWVDTLRRKKLKPETIAGANAVLSGAFREAARLQVVPVNVVRGVRLPRIPRHDHATWTGEQVGVVFRALADDPMWHAVYRLALMTGMRPGELRALRWSDVDLAGAVVLVRRTITKDEHGHETVGSTTKTGTGRAVSIPPGCVLALKVWQVKQGGRRDAYVFSGGQGQPLGHTTWTKYHKRLIARINAGRGAEDQIPVITLHEMRHSSATLELAAGTPVKIVSERLGHRKTETTSNLYQHVDVSLQRAAVNALEERIERAVNE